MVPAVHAGASFQHRSNLSAKNLQAFNAYQTHLYPDMYTDYRQGKISEVITKIFLFVLTLFTNSIFVDVVNISNVKFYF